MRQNLAAFGGPPGPNRHRRDRGPVEQPLPNPWADDGQEFKW
jgi:hypothetical protein